MARPRAVTDEAILAAARRCFLERGASISAAEIARELGVTHTTVFNRFRTKEALLIAALGPPEVLPWAAAVDAGPDGRPVPEQLEEIGKRISDYFAHILPGLAMLNAAGLGPSRSSAAGESLPQAGLPRARRLAPARAAARADRPGGRGRAGLHHHRRAPQPCLQRAFDRPPLADPQRRVPRPLRPSALERDFTQDRRCT